MLKKIIIYSAANDKNILSFSKKLSISKLHELFNYYFLKKYRYNKKVIKAYKKYKDPQILPLIAGFCIQEDYPAKTREQAKALIDHLSIKELIVYLNASIGAYFALAEVKPSRIGKFFGKEELDIETIYIISLNFTNYINTLIIKNNKSLAQNIIEEYRAALKILLDKKSLYLKDRKDDDLLIMVIERMYNKLSFSSLEFFNQLNKSAIDLYLQKIEKDLDNSNFYCNIILDIIENMLTPGPKNKEEIEKYLEILEYLHKKMGEHVEKYTLNLIANTSRAIAYLKNKLNS